VLVRRLHQYRQRLLPHGAVVVAQQAARAHRSREEGHRPVRKVGEARGGEDAEVGGGGEAEVGRGRSDAVGEKVAGGGGGVGVRRVGERVDEDRGKVRVALEPTQPAQHGPHAELLHEVAAAVGGGEHAENAKVLARHGVLQRVLRQEGGGLVAGRRADARDALAVGLVAVGVELVVRVLAAVISHQVVLEGGAPAQLAVAEEAADAREEARGGGGHRGGGVGRGGVVCGEVALEGGVEVDKEAAGKILGALLKGEEELDEAVERARKLEALGVIEAQPREALLLWPQERELPLDPLGAAHELDEACGLP